MSWFVTGTASGCGKTWFASNLVNALRNEGIQAAGYKPICCGEEEDAKILAEASGNLEPGELTSLWLKAPADPQVAAMLAHQEVDVDQVVADCKAFAERFEHVVFEGNGGWRTPLAEGYEVGDLAVALGYPVILVISNERSALNHAILTVDSMRRKGAKIQGIVLNNLADELDTAMIANKGVIEQFTGLPLLEEIIHGQDFLDVDAFLESA